MATTTRHTASLEQQVEQLKGIVDQKNEIISQQRKHILHLERAAVESTLAARREDSIWDEGNVPDPGQDRSVYIQSTTDILYKSKKTSLEVDLSGIELELAWEMECLKLVTQETQEQEEVLQDNRKMIKASKKELQQLNNQLQKVEHKVKINNISNQQTNVKADAMTTYSNSMIDNSTHHHHHHHHHNHHYHSQQLVTVPPALDPQSIPSLATLPTATATTTAKPITLVDRTKPKAHRTTLHAHHKKEPKLFELCKFGNGCRIKRCRHLHPKQIELYGNKVSTAKEDAEDEEEDDD